ncbi:MAG: nucleoside kinase [Ruminococcaceae bacterium]|nr:nucleoside kinase [Oscillospiraceae bacterium]
MEKRSVNTKTYRNYVNLQYINDRALRDPRAFVEESEAVYAEELRDTALAIAAAPSKIVLLSGPSSSGKTTTAKRLRGELSKLGIRAHHVEMDNYFLDTDRNDPTIDLESPERMDMTLLHAHLEALDRGDEVPVPHFDFTTGRRSGKTEPLRLMKDEIAIFEGIHALNDALYDKTSAHAPVGVYLSARMRVVEDDRVIVEPEWTRFVRRALRDASFRGTDIAGTMGLWPNVRRGEVRYIMPFKHRAELMIDTSLDYELCVLAPRMLARRAELDLDLLSAQGMGALPSVLERFLPLDEQFVPQESLLREFIGK